MSITEDIEDISMFDKIPIVDALLNIMDPNKFVLAANN